MYLENRLAKAFAFFLEREKGNKFARIGKEGWELSKDPEWALRREAVKQFDIAKLIRIADPTLRSPTLV